MKRRSLKRKLTWRLIFLQIAVLAIFAVAASIPLSQFEVTRLNTAVERVAESLTRQNDTLALEPGDDLRRLMADNPQFWFHAVAEDGQSVTYGTVPPEYEAVLAQVGSTRLALFGTGGDFSEVDAVARQITDGGEVYHVITGGGPLVGPISFKILVANKFFMTLIALLTLVTSIAIPLIVRHELRGLSRVADEADTIDMSRRGTRLPEDDIPVEMRSVVSAVNRALTRLDEGIERRHKFLADAAHELRTPIAIVQTRVEMLPANAEQRDLQLSVARLANLAEQLLDLERLDAGVRRFERFDIVELAAEVASDLAPLAINAGAEIAFEAAKRPLWVTGDRSAIARALTNLIQNALTHARDDALVDVRVDSDGTVSVADNGVGISPEDRERVFEPFYRIFPKERGAGLGLNLVRQVAERHGAKVDVGQSRLGGALFSLRFPLAG